LVIGIEADALEATDVARTATPDGSGGGWAARLSTRLGARPSPAKVAARLRAEIETNGERWMLWSPVAFGLGAAGYLELRAEPSWALLVGLTAGLALLAGLTGRRWGRPGLSLLLALATLLAAGGLAGKVRSTRVAAPILAGDRTVMTVEGFVVDVVSPGAGGPRLLIAPVTISGLAAADTPRRVRVTVGAEDIAPPGQAVRLRAMLGPPPPPAAPGAYDFARDAWFHGVGGVGFEIGEGRPVALDPPPARLRLAMAVNAYRWRLASRIVARMGPERGGIAAAMVTGHEAWITKAQTEAMRASGLAHILSISGLHMAIVGGFCFGLARLAIAAWPWAALRVPGKKIAALAGLAAVGTYLVISGAPPPALRAAITATVAFAAILFDRQAISLHGLATGPFAMQHFNRVAVWGLPANLAVAPLSSFVIMPFLAIGAALEGAGLGGPFLTVAGWGIDGMMAIANGFASASGAQMVVASGPPFTLALAFVGLMLLCLWRGRLRWLGAPLALSVALWPRPAAPDVWIAPDGATAAVRRGQQAVLLRPDARRFGAELWSRRRGLAIAPGETADPAYACERRACLPTAAAPVALALSWSRVAPDHADLAAMCAVAEIVVLRGAAPVKPAACRDRVVLDAADFAAGGAAELYRRRGEWWIVRAQPLRGVRPWTGLY